MESQVGGQLMSEGESTQRGCYIAWQLRQARGRWGHITSHVGHGSTYTPGISKNACRAGKHRRAKRVREETGYRTAHTGKPSACTSRYP